MEIYYLLQLLGFVALTLRNVQVSANHSPPHGTETDVFNFHYDQDTGFFVGSNRLTCILVSLNKHERDEVYGTRGIERIELTMMKDWMGVLPEVTLLHTDPLLSRNIIHWCDNRKIIMLQRTPSSAKVTELMASSKQGTATPYTNTFSGLPFDTTIKSVSQRTTLQVSITKPTTASLESVSKNSLQNTEMTTTIGTESSSQMLTGYTSKQTEQKHDITTSEVLASATSQHTMKTTTPSSFGSYVIYDKSSNIKINAVIVDKDVCYVYYLTDTEVKLVNMGSSIREAFERALLSKDRTTVLQNPLYINGAANQVQQTCKGTVFLLV